MHQINTSGATPTPDRRSEDPPALSSPETLSSLLVDHSFIDRSSCGVRCTYLRCHVACGRGHSLASLQVDTGLQYATYMSASTTWKLSGC